ncbi:MAG: DUF5667 domain-containing protein [Candidatus Dormibacteraeota bacterium]|nr:DUF5667 domain-containing protein [Candidatus Dormibacteraeota bacterium]
MLVEPSPKQLEDAIARRQAGAPVAQAVGVHPAAEELEGMLGLSEQIAALNGGAAQSGARSRVRDAFDQGGAMHRARWVHQHQLPIRRSKHPLPSHGIRWSLVVGTALMLALLAGVSLALAAQLSEPDGNLYPLKLNTERLLVAANRSPVSQAGVRMQLANQRYRDAEAMAARGKGKLAVASMQAYYDQLRLAGAALAGAQHDPSWKAVRAQYLTAEAKPIDNIVTQLQNTHQVDALAGVKALSEQFAKDRKDIDAKLNPLAPTPGTGQPQPLPSGAQPQPGSSP